MLVAGIMFFCCLLYAIHQEGALPKAQRKLAAEERQWMEDVKKAFREDNVDVARFKGWSNSIDRRKDGLRLSKAQRPQAAIDAVVGPISGLFASK